MYDESGGGDVVLVAPGLDIAEAHKLVSMQSQHSLAFLHLCRYIFVGTFCDASAAFASCFANGVNDGVDIFFMLGISH